MSGIGAELPPHLLAKRKRQREEDAKIQAASASGANQDVRPKQDTQDKRRRVVGPSMPPAPIDQMPQQAPDGQILHQHAEKDDDDSESDSEDEFGPTAPAEKVGDSTASMHEDARSGYVSNQIATTSEEKGNAKLRRDDWMTMPPTQDGLAARMDPTKQRPKGFNTGKGARGPNSGNDDNSAWHETPEQKQKRLQDEMMGVTKPQAVSVASSTTYSKQTSRTPQSTNQKQEHAPSLLELHQNTKRREDIEDDPSKRAFDREKDMGSGSRISASQKREMLGKASNFNSRFSGGSFL